MSLPPRYTYPLYEVAARWSCTPADLAEWATMGQFKFVTGVPLVRCDGRAIAGMVALHAADMIPMFRRDGTTPAEVRVHRVRPLDESDFSFITDPEEGLMISRADIFIPGDDVRDFEAAHDLVRRSSSQPGGSRYDWDAMYVAVAKRIHERGLPDTQVEFVGEFQDWFARRDSNGDAPDESSIRRRLNPIWRALRDAA